MQVGVLGPLTLRYGANYHDLALPKSGAVLALLAMSAPRPVSFESLVEEVWLDKPISNAKNALQANVKRLRTLLGELVGRPGEEILRTTYGGYRLDVPDGSVDAHRFLALTERGGRLVDSDPDQAVEVLGTALDQWRGPALFNISDGPRLGAEAINLGQRWLKATEDRFSARLGRGEPGREVLSELEPLAARHPERERLIELQMLALYDDGRQAEALEAFHQARRRMVGELGLEPGRALYQLYQAILAQDERLGRPKPLRACSPRLAT